MYKIKNLVLLILLFTIICFSGAAELFSAAERNEQPVAAVMIGSSGIYFSPKVSYGQILLTVSAPDGTIYRKKFDSGGTPYLGLSEVCKNQIVDGHYTYELRVNPGDETRIRDEATDLQMKTEMKPQVALTQSGHFLVRGGGIIKQISTERMSQPMDVTHTDDVVITGGLCVGYDCFTDGTETFGTDTIKLKDINPRIFFDDTSSTSSFPSNDWRILINDIVDGGANYFAVEDASSGNRPLYIEAGAPDNSLYVEDFGRIGLNTSTPDAALHIVAKDTPSMRLDQSPPPNNYSAQIWDVAGNETNFFVRDATNITLPFKIQPGAPSDALCIKADGRIGVGTWTPLAQFHIEKKGENAAIAFSRSDGAFGKFSARVNEIYMGTGSNHNVQMVANNVVVMTMTPNATVGIGITTPTHKLDVGSSGAYCNGGAWVDGSSRNVKKNIRDITLIEAKEALNNLNPVKFNYKEDDSEESLGFIAEDVPELVATKDRKGMSPMDVVAVLTKVVQEQQKTITQLQEKIAKLEKTK